MADFIPFADYLIRPSMIDGESVAGYVFRYLGANGHKMSKKFFLVLTRLYSPKRGAAADALKIIRGVIGENNAFEVKFLLNRPNEIFSLYQDEWAYPAIKHVRLCPFCLDEKGYHLSLWELPLFYACPVHGCALLEACPICGNTYRWDDLNPGWICRCGTAVRTIRPKLPQAGMAGLANLLVTATDVVIPKGLKRSDCMALGKPYELTELYAAMELGLKIAKQISPKKHFVFRTVFDKRSFVVVPKPTLGWAARLISDSPANLVKRFRRLLTRYFRTPGKLITAINNNDALAIVAVFLEKQPDSLLKQKLFTALFDSVEPYRVKLPFQMMVLHDTNLTQKEFMLHLVHFAEWWTNLCRRIKTLESTIQQTPHPENRTTIEPGDENHFIFTIIDILLLSPQRKMEAEAFLGISHWWPIPKTLHNTVPAHETVYRIVEHLKSLSLKELALAHDMVLTANYITLNRITA